MNGYRASVLREMGLAPIWRLRAGDDRRDASSATVEAPTTPDSPPEPRPAVRENGAAVRTDPAPDRSGRMQPIGRFLSEADRATQAPPAPPAESGASRLTEGDPGQRARIAALDWEALEADIRACRRCGLCERRRQAVPGVGDRNADWMFVGEGPGAEEDRRGEPFVGPAGKLLDAMLKSIGLSRDHGVYIANSVKCRPPMNRTPNPDEIETCLPYLERQIALVRPRLLIALGRPAAQALLGREVRINHVRGQVFSRDGIPVIVTYHPAYLLRNLADKSKAWEDLCFARAHVATLMSAEQ